MSDILLTCYPVGGDAPITQLFGEHPQWYREYGQAGHNGVDWGVALGTPVRAAADGVVIFAGQDPLTAKNPKKGYGYYVKVQHAGAYQTIYAHLAELDVHAHEIVQAGDVIGVSGSTGNSSGPHLHFELRTPFQRIPGYPDGARDPLPYFAALSNTEPAPATSTPTAVFEPGIHRVIVPSLNIRTGPCVLSEDVGDLVAGSFVDVIGAPVKDGAVLYVPVQLWVALEQNGERYLE